MQYPLLIVGVFIAVFVCTYVLIFTEKINRTLAALLGAVVIVSLGEAFASFLMRI